MAWRSATVVSIAGFVRYELTCAVSMAQERADYARERCVLPAHECDGALAPRCWTRSQRRSCIRRQPATAPVRRWAPGSFAPAAATLRAPPGPDQALSRHLTPREQRHLL